MHSPDYHRGESFQAHDNITHFWMTPLMDLHEVREATSTWMPMLEIICTLELFLTHEPKCLATQMNSDPPIGGTDICPCDESIKKQ